ncbi:hypothetical protein HYS93_00610 [Candidatus Daviesbacteria bacterium]|nr:hypothetical protein [Candidatus Daviesbacteria bacterium]
MALAEGCPVIDLSGAQRADFTYFDNAQTTQALATIGYGPTKMLADAHYLSPDRSLGVTILLVTQKRCRDHFGVLRGVDGVEALAQAYLLHRVFAGEQIEAGSRPLFIEINGARFASPAVQPNSPDQPPFALNLVTMATEAKGKSFSWLAWALRGNELVTQATLSGRIISEAFYKRMIQGTREAQDNTTPLFPYQG